jgi:CelD/BcsL family acetyltransferase involved in cellulose biosynthesis
MARCGVVNVRVSGVADFTGLGERWRDLEQRSDGSFFQSWTWVGCLAAERYPDADLVEATDAGRIVALGLFNRVSRRFGLPTLHLGETGSADLDCPYVEQNGFLVEAGHRADLVALCLRRLIGTHDLVLSGVGEAVLASVQRAAPLTHTVRCHPSWFIDLAAIRRAGQGYLAGRSANTRAQLRRSDRFYELSGPVTLERADTLSAAQAMLDAMADLHQTAWEGRGKPGSFASPFFRRFHHALIEAGFLRRDVTVMKISAGELVIGFLYNFIWRGRMSAYQSGFAYRDDETKAKPGLTCHLAAIRDALHQGVDVYDFLAGDDRYKRSLADQSHPQYWLEAGPYWSVRLLHRKLTRALRSAGSVAAD